MSNIVSIARNHKKNFRNLSIFVYIYIQNSILLYWLDVTVLRFQNWKSWYLGLMCWTVVCERNALVNSFNFHREVSSRKFLEAWRILTLVESNMGSTANVFWGCVCVCVCAIGGFEKLEESLHSLNRTWVAQYVSWGWARITSANSSWRQKTCCY